MPFLNNLEPLEDFSSLKSLAPSNSRMLVGPCFLGLCFVFRLSSFFSNSRALWTGTETDERQGLHVRHIPPTCWIIPVETVLYGGRSSGEVEDIELPLH
jgi:hypothetical protein